MRSREPGVRIGLVLEPAMGPKCHESKQELREHVSRSCERTRSKHSDLPTSELCLLASDFWLLAPDFRGLS